jgi:nitrate/nitrite transport system ATP-binding protein
MVTYDVDEAILLSDRIALMTNGPDARLAETLEVDMPRPRRRETMIDTPEYARLRNHILHFLLEDSKPRDPMPTPELASTFCTTDTGDIPDDE